MISEHKIINVLKDGTVVDDLTGHIVKKTESPTVYAVVARIEERKMNNDNLLVNDPEVRIKFKKKKHHNKYRNSSKNYRKK